MKYLMTFILLLGAFSQPALAGPGKRGEWGDHRERHMERMIEELELTGEQEPQVRQILDEQHDKMRARMEAIHEQMRPAMEALKAETTERLSAVLNKEQMQTFEAHMEKNQERMQQMRKRWQDRKGRDAGE